jgi:non-lysosomal glucosylceramidase
MAEGMLMEGLAIARMIHDRYHASRRNPWNEVECGDHYARSMASHGVYLAACGFEHHGPKGHIGFAPRLSPNDFRAAFTAAEGWGTFSQKVEGGIQRAGIAVKWGRLRVRTLALGLAEGSKAAKASVMVDGRPAAARLETRDGRAEIRLEAEAIIPEGGKIEVEIS